MAPKQPIARSKPYSIFIVLVVSALLLASCGSPSSILSTVSSPVPPSPTPLAPTVGLPTPTSIPPSPTPQAPLDTPTSIPPSPTPLLVEATPTLAAPSPTPQMLSNAVLINPSIASGNIALITGTTAGVLQGTVQPGQVLSYTLNAGQAQPLTLIMSSPNSDVTLGFFEANGNTLLDPASRYTRWQMALPAAELYTIQVIGGATTETFSLTIKLPLVVNFASGASSAVLNGTTVNGYLFSYSLNCAVGQTMTAGLNVPSSTAYIDIYGLSTGTLLDASAEVNSWTGILPQTQDYIIEVVPTNGQVVSYSLSVSCTGTPGSPYIPPVNTTTSSGGQLFIAPGQTEAIVGGMIQPGQVVSYSVQANQFQPMILIVSSPNNDVVLGALDPNGNTLLDPGSMYTYWQWMLPQTGLYTIHVVGGQTTEKYTLTTKIGKLYTFPASGNSITIYATTLKGYIKSYAFRLSAGDVMTLTLNVPSSTAYLDVFGIQTGSILNASERATTWTGTLTSQQEYVVEVIPGGTEGAYTLTISNP